MDVEGGVRCRVVGGVDTHKDLHVAAVVDEQDHVLGTQCFATTRQGYRQMLAWMPPSLRQSMNGSQFPGGLTLTAMDRLVGWRRKASRCGLTHTPIDPPCLSPDLSAARDRLAGQPKAPAVRAR